MKSRFNILYTIAFFVTIIPYVFSKKQYQFKVIAFADKENSLVGLKIDDKIVPLVMEEYPLWKGEYFVDIEDKYHYVLMNNADANDIIDEENFERTVKYALPDGDTTELINEFFGEEHTVYQHPRLPKSYALPKDFNANKYSELFDDRFISTIVLKGNSTQLAKMKKAYIKPKNNIPTLQVDATIITPFTTRKCNNLLLELNDYAKRISVETDSNDIKPSFFLTYNENSTTPLNDGIFNKTSIQLFSTSTDLVLLRNKLYVDMCNSIGIPSAQVAFAKVFFNEDPMGFFLIKENLNTDYFSKFYNSPSMYGQLGYKNATMANFGSVTSKNLKPEEMNQEETDKYAEYWYKGKEVADESRDKSDLVELFRTFEEPHTLNDINSVYNTDDFLKAMALDYISNNRNGYLYNGYNYFLFFDQEKNIWNYHEGYFNYPFNIADNNETVLPYELFRPVDAQRPAFDYLIELPGERGKFEGHVENILYRIFNFEVLSQRIDTLFDMINENLKWDITFNGNTSSNLSKRSSLNVIKTLKLKKDMTKLKEWIGKRHERITREYGIIPERSYNCPYGVVDNQSPNNMKYKEKSVEDNACISVGIPFNIYSLFTNCFLISLPILFLHLFWAVFINPIVWRFSNKKRRVKSGVFFRLWLMAVALLFILVISVYFWIRHKPLTNVYRSVENQIYYKMLDYGDHNVLIIIFNIALWIILNRENFTIFLCFLFVKWPRFNKKRLNKEQPSNNLDYNSYFVGNDYYNDESECSSVTFTEENSNSTIYEETAYRSEVNELDCTEVPKYASTTLSMEEFYEEKIKKRYYCESLNSRDLFKSKNVPTYTTDQYKIIKMYNSIRHAFLIVCHNSSDVLPETLEHLLNVTSPMCILIAENGSTEEERIKMSEICTNYSQKFRDTHPDYNGLDIIYANLNEGSKTLAQFCLLNNLRWFGIDIEFVTIIDDDVLIPPEWVEEEILTYFDNDPNVKALAYPIATANRRDRVVPAFQNFEYHLSMYSKKFHRDVGSVLFTSGAIGTWSIPILIEALYRHDTVFRGEDLQLGLRLHTMYGKSKFCDPNHYHEGNYKIEMSHVTVETLVPGCYIHIHDILPDWLGKYFKKCDCGEYSLARQRIIFWEPARHRFIPKFIDCITHKCKITHRATITAKIFTFDILLSVFNDYFCLFFLIFVFLKHSYLPVIMVLCISFAIAYVSYDIFNIFVARGLPDVKLPFEVCATFPVCYQFFSTLFYRFSSIVYNTFYYLPFVRNKPKIKSRALKKDISAMTMSSILTEDGSELAIANVWEIAEFLKEGKKVKRKRRKDTQHKIWKHKKSMSKYRPGNANYSPSSTAAVQQYNQESVYSSDIISQGMPTTTMVSTVVNKEGFTDVGMNEDNYSVASIRPEIGETPIHESNMITSTNLPNENVIPNGFSIHSRSRDQSNSVIDDGASFDSERTTVKDSYSSNHYSNFSSQEIADDYISSGFPMNKETNVINNSSYLSYMDDNGQPHNMSYIKTPYFSSSVQNINNNQMLDGVNLDDLYEDYSSNKSKLNDSSCSHDQNQKINKKK